MANLRDFTGKNRRFTGTSGIISSDTDATTAQRVDEKGRLRFNNTLGLMEYYNGTTWIAIDAPPSISSLTPSSVNIPDSATTVNLQINGSNFSVGVTGSIFNNSGTEINFATFSRVSDTRIDATITVADLGTIDDPYDVKVVNASGLANTLADGLTFNEKPTWNTSAGSLFSIFNAATGTHATLSATDPEGGTVNYRLRSGSLPAGLSLDTSNGAISGDPTDVNTSTTSSFTIGAFDSGSAETVRAFTATVSPPPTGGTITSYSNYTVHSFTSTGTTDFVTSTDLTADILVVGGGGAGGSQGTSETGGGGGAGGFRTATGVTVPAGTHTVTVGSGGTGVGGTGGDGGATSFGTLLAASGGGGGAQQETNGRPGGSGGGAGGIDSSVPANTGGSGNAGGYTPSEGNPGGNNNNGVGDMGAGGGGASNAGEGINTGPRGGGAGGNGATNDFRTGSNVTYAGGGGGGMNTSSTTGPGGSGGGGNGNPGGSGSGSAGTNGLGGGGGGGTGPGTVGGNGGNGIAVIRFEL